MIADLERLRESALEELQKAEEAESLGKIKSHYLGRNGALTTMLRSTGKLTPAERPVFGKRANQIKSELEQAFDLREKAILGAKGEKADRALDVTLPGFRVGRGAIHPITRTLNRMIEIFQSMGYEVATGPEVEWDRYNFSLLNFPDNHPARDMQDTFFVSKDILMRTHTSPVQVRAMESRKPPLRIISPGKVYRHDRDASHSPMFFQLEGFVVDRGISFADLKGTLAAFIQRLFRPDTRLRFRPSFFPFTEPSAEVDISCFLCGGSGCRMCKQTGWIEILGSGMIHPQVLRNVGIDPEEYTGFAFGMGVERITILKYGVEPIATFLENDLRFLRQFY